jgi:uncharacterized phage protein (TIGR02218 family)
VKAASSALLAHQAGQTRTIARCWRFQRRDGTVITVTNAGKDITYAGELYKAVEGMTPAAIDQSNGGAVVNSELVGMLTGNTLTESAALAAAWDGCAYVVFEVNYQDLTMGRMILATGTLGNISVGRTGFKAEQRGLTQALQQQIGYTYTPTCTANLGDSRCKVNLASYTVGGTLTGFTDRRTIVDSGRSEAADWFGNGTITFTSGANNGVSMEVLTFAGGQFKLALPLPFNPAAGDAYTAVAGCRKTLKGNQSALGAVSLPLSGSYTIYDTSRTEASGYFAGGSVLFTGGANNGKAYNVISSAPGSFVLATLPSGTVGINDTYIITPPASTLYNGHCKTKFNNVVNFRGFPSVPGSDKILGLGGTQGTQL